MTGNSAKSALLILNYFIKLGYTGESAKTGGSTHIKLLNINRKTNPTIDSVNRGLCIYETFFIYLGYIGDSVRQVALLILSFFIQIGYTGDSAKAGCSAHITHYLFR